MEILVAKKYENTKPLIIIKKIIPYILILLFTIVACQLNFYKGYPTGDDVRFHVANIYDWFLELKGDGSQLISSNLAGHLGVGKKLFYSPFAHFVPAFLAYTLHISIISSIKLTLFLSVYISGIFMYKFAYKISNGMPLLSVLSAGVYIIWPYRLFDAYCRLAYAEAISFLFLPLFFMGLYDLCHYKELNIIPFLEIIFGSVLLFLTHNLTGFYAFFFGGIFLLINVKKIIIKIIENKFLILYAAITGFIIICMLSLTIFSSYTLLNKDYYNISNETYMWTTVKNVTNRNLDAIDYSGFLNIPWLKNSGLDGTSPTQLISGIIMFFVSILVLILVNELCKNIINKFDKYKAIKIIDKFKIYLLIPIVIFIIFVHLNVLRKEVIYATYLAGFSYIFIELFNDLPKEHKRITTSVSFYSYAILLILTLLMIFFGDFWRHAPKLFLNIQFPWRLWAFVSLYVSILVAYVLRKYSKKQYYIITAVVIGFLSSTTMATIEKRGKREQNSDSWIYDVDEKAFTDYRHSTGACFEYFPYMYYPSDGSYVSKYSNSLYSKVRNIIFNFKLSAYDIHPAILEGYGTVTVDKEKTKVPNYYMNCTIEEDNTLIQLPIVYYPGYEITAKTETGKKIKLKVVDVDGLVSFYINSGTYDVKTDYVGTKLRHATEVLQVISVITLFGFGYLDIVLSNKKNKKDRLFLE